MSHSHDFHVILPFVSEFLGAFFSRPNLIMLLRFALFPQSTQYAACRAITIADCAKCFSLQAVGSELDMIT